MSLALYYWMRGAHHCSGPPVSKMTYTVSSGTFNSIIPYHTHLFTLHTLPYPTYSWLQIMTNTLQIVIFKTNELADESRTQLYRSVISVRTITVVSWWTEIRWQRCAICPMQQILCDATVEVTEQKWMLPTENHNYLISIYNIMHNASAEVALFINQNSAFIVELQKLFFTIKLIFTVNCKLSFTNLTSIAQNDLFYTGKFCTMWNTSIQPDTL